MHRIGQIFGWWNSPGKYWAEETSGQNEQAKRGAMGGKTAQEEKRPAEGKEAGAVGEKRYVTLIKSLLLALLPLLCCVVYCAGQGRGLKEVYIPSSEWNDELFYYKQVEGILHYGYPQGYFGFNESHALELSFAAWSPVLVFPWILWGLVFGWNLMSAVYCNIFLMCLSCFLFVWLVRPTWKQMGILTFLFALYRPLTRFMLSLMAEVICFAMVILFTSLAINYLHREKGYKLTILFVMAGVMVLMRPYLVLFLLLPVFLFIRRGRGTAGKWLRALYGSAVVAGVLGLYAVIKHYFGAAYFTPLFFTDWIESFFEEGILGGIYFTIRKLYYVGTDFLGHIRRGFESGLASGGYFVGYLACMGILAVQSFRDWRTLRGMKAPETGNVAEGSQGAEPRIPAEMEKETVGKQESFEVSAAAAGRTGSSGESAAVEIPGRPAVVHGVREMLVVEAHLLFSFVAMFFALLLMYKLTEGSRHLLTFMAAAIFLVSLMETRFYKKAVLLGAIFAYFHSYMALDPFDYQVPFWQEERGAAVEDWQEAMEERMELVTENVPNYDNSVIWVFSDLVEGETVRTSYQLLYGLPKGFGISCCMREYVIPNIDALKSRYLAIPTGGEIDLLCQEKGYALVYGDEEMVLYELYGTG